VGKRVAGTANQSIPNSVMHEIKTVGRRLIMKQSFGMLRVDRLRSLKSNPAMRAIAKWLV
jgi:hypothetical protein